MPEDLEKLNTWYEALREDLEYLQKVLSQGGVLGRKHFLGKHYDTASIAMSEICDADTRWENLSQHLMSVHGAFNNIILANFEVMARINSICATALKAKRYIQKNLLSRRRQVEAATQAVAAASDDVDTQSGRSTPEAPSGAVAHGNATNSDLAPTLFRLPTQPVVQNATNRPANKRLRREGPWSAAGSKP